MGVGEGVEHEENYEEEEGADEWAADFCWLED